jgi:hypothetical protein
MLNNFLDIDKVNVAFWGFIAIITSFDLYANQEADTPERRERDALARRSSRS